MKVIGVTGAIGSGKSYVAKLISERGIPRIDTDEVYHGLVSGRSSVTEAIEKNFGSAVIAPNGSLNRVALGRIVFSDPEKLRVLNEITHEAVKSEVRKMLADYRQKGEEAVIVEVPLMFESGFDKECDEVVCVAADDDVRLGRICKRDGLSQDDAKKRMKNQKDNDFYIANSSIIVYNNGNEDIDLQVSRILDAIRGDKSE